MLLQLLVRGNEGRERVCDGERIFTGDPRIIFMDEPTTGMDPNTRQDMWEMIKLLKKRRAIILTTHAMEEAEALADRIVIIAGGEVKCIGTSLYLKNHFSDGYRLSLIFEERSFVEQAKIELQRLMPSAKVTETTTGSLLIAVPVTSMNELNEFFLAIENEEDKEKKDEVLDIKQHSIT